MGLHSIMQWFSNFFAMENFDIIGKIIEPLFKSIFSTIKAMFHLTELM